MQDKEGNPYHVVMKRKKSLITNKIIEILSRFPINPHVPPKRTAKWYTTTMEEVAKKFQRTRILLPYKDLSVQSPTVDMLDIDSVSQDIEEMLTELSGRPQSYFEPPMKKSSLPQSHANHTKSEGEDPSTHHNNKVSSTHVESETAENDPSTHVESETAENDPSTHVESETAENDPSTHVESETAENDPSTHVESETAENDPSTHVESETAENDPSTHVESETAENDPSTHVESETAENDPSTHVESETAENDSSTHVESETAENDPSTHVESETAENDPSTHVESETAENDSSTHVESETPSTHVESENDPSTHVESETPSTHVESETAENDPSTHMESETAENDPSTHVESETAENDSSTHVESETPSTHVELENDPSIHVESETPSTHVESETAENDPSTHVESETPSTHVESETPSTHVESETPSTHVESGTPSTHVESETPSTHVESETPSTHVESETPSTHVESETPSTHVESGTPSTHVESEIPSIHVESETAVKDHQVESEPSETAEKDHNVESEPSTNHVESEESEIAKKESPANQETAENEPLVNHVEESLANHVTATLAASDISFEKTLDTLPSKSPLLTYDKVGVGINYNFEGHKWVVECTEKVKKYFANEKVPRSEKEAVFNAVIKLTHGIPIHNLKKCKKLSDNLYEARYSKASRVIFELAIQFSTRHSTKGNYVYSEVIRLWDIVRDHDKLKKRIEHILSCIKKTQGGKMTAIPMKMQKSKQSTQGQEQIRLPQLYTSGEDVETFLPEIDIKDGKCSVTTFFSVDDSFVNAMLNGENARRDFPFKGWPKEHDIINMPHGKCSILLLGRSGTGKTTVCLYRLWNQFITYWMKVVDNEPLLSQKPLSILKGLSEDDTRTETSEAERVTILDKASPSPCVTDISCDKSVNFEHLHQVFITKNHILCAQLKEQFYDLAASRDIAKTHMAYEDVDTPTSLCDLDDHAYPLFLTARQFFVILDNSLQDDKNFFPRDKDGNLTEKSISSNYDHEDADTLLHLEESEDFRSQASVKNLPPRRIVSALYFCEKIWHKIFKDAKLKDARIDPLLVWMEIKSFIKGSMDAVATKRGYLTKEDYKSIGKKMASNYADNREDIYKLFEQYQRFIKSHSLIDECDLSHNIYLRLNAMKDLPWSIHSIYIDEVQDFTQAELSILVRICRYPNDLFLTGDTAQSIMRGVSFRFSDLRTIFHHIQASKSSKPASIKVPKVDQLAINFRSNSGVLKLASSVIDLMATFFPNSFDHLPGDKGMFPGSKPIVLDSCNVVDLALVGLRTNKDESSFEFGARQVIIVQSEEAKKTIPDVLNDGIPLTIFESKGLEFDDVLLYNFFKDSKVSNHQLFCHYTYTYTFTVD